MEPAQIRTGELLLRAWRPTDAEAVREACQDPVLAGWSRLPEPFTRADADRFVAEAGARNDRLLALAIVDDDRLLGSVDLRDLDPHAHTAELGYWSAPWARGRRVTERAARALLRHAFDNLGLERADWRATIGNHASRLTALRLGFRMIGPRPGTSDRPAEWLATLVPGDLTGPGEELPDTVRRQALIFGGAMPELTAGPLRLRAMTGADVPAIAASGRDPEVTRWYGPDPHAEALVHEVAPRRWADGTEAIFAVVDPAGDWVGTVDLRITPADPRVGEVGYLITPHARGRGYATAALREVTRWGFAEWGLSRVQWRAEVGNDASRRVAEKAGFTVEGTLRQALEANGRRVDCWIGARVRTDRD